MIGGPSQSQRAGSVKFDQKSFGFDKASGTKTEKEFNLSVIDSERIDHMPDISENADNEPGYFEIVYELLQNS